jgi:PAB-dependent poly(A)-specific ribonuclease subunit 3
MHQSAFSAIETWSRIRQPNIVFVKEAFTTRAFGDNCLFRHLVLLLQLTTSNLALVVVYAYHPNAQTLYDASIKVNPPTFHHGRLQSHSNAIPENVVWSYIIQISNAIKAVHEAGQAVRMIDLTKIIVTGKGRSEG